ncbi:MAG: hypothetical protein R6W82_04030 [bacterium]
MRGGGVSRGRGRTPARPSRTGRGRVLLVIAAGVGLCLAYLGGMNRSLELAGEVEGLRRERDAVRRKVDHLSLRLAEARRGHTVVEEARGRLGMQFPSEQIPVLAVQPGAARGGPSLWTYMENALVMAAEGLQRHLSPEAMAREAAPDSARGG